MEILVVDVQNATPAHHGGAERLYSVVGEILRDPRVKAVDYAALSRIEGSDSHRRLARMGVRRQEVARSVDSARMSLEGIVSSAHYDVIIFFYYYTFEVLGGLARTKLPEARCVIDTQDLQGLRVRRGAALGYSGPFGDTFADERSALLSADEVWVSSEADSSDARTHYGVCQSYVIPPIFAPVSSHDVVGADRQDVVFVGPSSHMPNLDGARWLTIQVLPFLRLQHHQIQLVGSDPAGEYVSLTGAGVSRMGWVPQIDEVLGRARVAVAPIRFGAGIATKLGSALAHGTPIVATPMAVRGYRARPPVAMASTPDAFAEEINYLLNDDHEWQLRSMAGLAYVERHYADTVLRNRIQGRISTWVHEAGGGN